MSFEQSMRPNRRSVPADRPSDESILQSLRWRTGADTVLRQAARRSDPVAFAERWAAWLQRRRTGDRRRSFDLLTAIQWSCPPQEARSERLNLLLDLLRACSHLVRRAGRTRSAIHGSRKSGQGKAGNDTRRVRVERLAGEVGALFDRSSAAEDQPTPLELLVVASILLESVGRLDADSTWLLLRVALKAAAEQIANGAVPLGKGQPAGGGDGSNFLRDRTELVRGEQLWLYSLLFSDMVGAARLGRQAKKFLNARLLASTDQAGSPHAALMDGIVGWLAPLVRATAWAERFGSALWDRPARRRFQSLVRVVTAMCLPDGQIALSSGPAHQTLSLLQAATSLAGLSGRTQPQRYLKQIGDGSNGRQRLDARPAAPKRPSDGWPGNQSDEAQLACLRSDWSTGSSTIVVAHNRPKPLLHLAARGQTLICGEWPIEVRLDGRPLRLAGAWDCVCWHSDEDVDYLELQLKVQGVTLERQVLLARQVGFALLADAVKSTGAERIDYTAKLPLEAALAAETQTASRECVLKRGRKRVARCFPLSLPENRAMSVAGELISRGDHLVLSQSVGRPTLYAPLVVDWDPSHRTAPAQWRTLTVSENRQIAPPEAAAGHRLRVGGFHLLVYRSLRHGPGLRAVLGHHTRYETVIGRLDAEGDLHPLLLVE